MNRNKVSFISLILHRGNKGGFRRNLHTGLVFKGFRRADFPVGTLVMRDYVWSFYQLMTRR